MRAKGTFEVAVEAEPSDDVVDGVALGRARVDKRFAGPLTATSRVDMMTVAAPAEGSRAYVALERITGTLEGKRGTFVVMHTATRTPRGQSLSVTVAPGSGTGELAGLSGRMEIEIVDGKHFYDFAYELGAAAP